MQKLIKSKQSGVSANITVMSRPLTALFIALDGYGHYNACIGLAQQLVKRGHRAVFAVERAWQGVIAKYEGLEEELYVDPTRDPAFKTNDYWINFMLTWKNKFPLPTIEALKKQDQELEWNFMTAMFNIDNELKRVIDKVKPDVMVVDTYCVIPTVYHSDIPWVWLTSANPLVCLPSDNLPPSYSGYPTKGPKSLWDEFRKVNDEVYQELIPRYCRRLAEFNIPPPNDGLMHPSPYLNIYAYPEETDYLDIRPLPPKWRRFDHFLRNEQHSPFEIPEKLRNTPVGKLVYVSMGSMGVADVDLLKRLIGIFAKSPNRFIFSLGPFWEQLELAPNQWGAKFVPQINVIKTVDLVITHGGNNSFVETLYYGRPMIVTPLSGDQHDNAQRITEIGLGARLSPYHATEQEFLDTIEKLLHDEQIKARLKTISTRMQQSNAPEKAAIEIENIVLVNNHV